jgi:A/G-specific adenine glycosylase
LARPASTAAPGALARALADWFAGHRRALPWRDADAGRRDAYRTWLSEVMLQQTRVAVVEDYFVRFLARFPDVRALADAREDDVLSLWSGLGYYSRGRNLHRAAREVRDAHGGAFPATAAELRALPGVGAYTASAVASLAFDERTAVVDGNVARVLARLHADHTAVDSTEGKTRIGAYADALVQAAPSAGAHNEALMELGALVCTPKSPSCGACPWRSACRAHAGGIVAEVPVKSPKRARTRLHVACVVIVDGDRVWLEKREERGLFGGLYAPPTRTIERDADAPAAWGAIARERGVAAPRAWPAPVVIERTLTHRDLRFVSTRIDVPASSARLADGRFVARDAVRTVGTSTAVRALLDVVWPAQRGLFS